MKVHEYQAKSILADFGVPVPRGKLASNPKEVFSAAQELGSPVIIKAQVHAGGRGKAGGIQLAYTPAEAEAAATKMFGKKLSTYQTAGSAITIRRVLVEQAVQIDKELYLSVVLDRSCSKPVIMSSTEGGVEIEEVAARTPHKIYKEWADPLVGLMSFQARRMAMNLDTDKNVVKQLGGVISSAFKAFMVSDASLVEINPLVITKDGKVIAVDAKMGFDDSALYRHETIAQMRDSAEEDPLEEQARTAGLSFVRLDGSIGCVVNGAGLAMATMDMVKHFGGEPANFLDIGGSSSPDKVLTAMRILLSDPKVGAVLFNIFGGITRCDDVAEGMVRALNELDEKPPIIVRLTGTNEDEGRRILESNGISVGSSMEDAVKHAVSVVKGGEES